MDSRARSGVHSSGYMEYARSRFGSPVPSPHSMRTRPSAMVAPSATAERVRPPPGAGAASGAKGRPHVPQPTRALSERDQPRGAEDHEQPEEWIRVAHLGAEGHVDRGPERR